MDKTRVTFRTVPEKNGYPPYLVMRYAFKNPELRRVLAPALRAWQATTGRTDTPNTIKLGDYIRQSDGRVGYVPRTRNPLAMAALDLEAVQRRIAEDLAIQNGD